MAHNLMSKDSFVAVKSAWHNLGIIDPTITRAVDAVSRSDLNYHIYKMPLSAMTPDGDMVAFDSFGLLRGPTPSDPRYRSLGTCAGKYDYWQNADVAALIDELSDKTGWDFETAGALGNGGTFFVTLRVKTWDIRGDDMVRYFSYIENRDGKSRAYALVGDTRIVCENTCNLALRTASGKVGITHHAEYKLDSDMVVSIVADTARAGSDLDKALNALADVRVTDEAFTDMLDSIAPMPKMDNLLTMPNLTGRMAEKRDSAERLYVQRSAVMGRVRNTLVNNWNDTSDMPVNLRGSGWHAFQSVTRYATHQHGTLNARGKRSTPATRADYDLFGGGVDMRKDAYLAIMGDTLF